MNTDNKKYLYNDITEKLIGFCFDIYKQIGGRHHEKIYQKAFENKLIESDFKYKRENYCKIEVDGKRVGSYKLDFLIENKIIVEFKIRDQLYNKDIAQILNYMKINNVKIGLIILFTSKGVKIKRLIN